MSEQDKSQQTEAPTPKKLEQAAKKGDVLQSRELGTALVVIAGAAWLAMAGPGLVGSLEQMMTDGLSFGAADVKEFDPGGQVIRLLLIIAVPLVILFGITMLAAVAGPAMLGSLGFRGQALGFKASKLNPLSGIKRIFGPQGLIELIKSLAKVTLIGSIGAWLIMAELPRIIGFGVRDTRAAIHDIGATFLFTVLMMAGSLALIALIDVPVQKIMRTRKLRMTKQEVKDEHKQSEGSPEVKGHIRAKQREMAKAGVRKVMGEATMVLTNPTHFAVALRYEPGMAAPVCVAKGVDELALRIRSVAAEHSVAVIENPPLARALHATVEIDAEIPVEHYRAVAEVIGFVLRLKRRAS